jgi:2-polyprenyl-3-methyl-5-hydroxy-6-metoxy-1,4-benzoquinol methylase
MRVVDLGCGTGELTQRLHRQVRQVQARETLASRNLRLPAVATQTRRCILPDRASSD